MGAGVDADSSVSSSSGELYFSFLANSISSFPQAPFLIPWSSFVG
jgi:hypothetical protein